MTAIILAAGMGRRLSLGTPKCLIQIAGRSILRRQIDAFRRAGAQRFVIVIGYRGEDVREHVADDPGPFTFIDNPRYAETNTIYSLYLARRHFGSGFLYANGDVVFDHRLVDRLMQAEQPAVMAVAPGACGQEEVKVMLEPSPTGMQARRIGRIGKQLDPAQSYGEFVGVARFGGEVVPALGAMLEQCVEAEAIVGDHFERAIDRLCSAGCELTPVDIHDLPCGEIDFPEDLEFARRELAPRLQ